MLWWLFFLAFKAEDVLKMLQLASPHEADAKLSLVSFEPVVGFPLVIKLQILCLLAVQAIFQRQIIEEGTVLFRHLGACGDASAHDYTETVVPQSFGEFESIVGVKTARCVGSALHVGCKVHTHGGQGTPRYGVYLTLQEAHEGTVHGCIGG